MADNTLFEMVNRFRPYFSPFALKVIDWRGLIGEVLRFKRHGGPTELEPWRKDVAPPGVEILFAEFPSAARELRELDGDARQEAGDRVLSVYFNQLASRDGAYLDMTPSRFRWLDGKLLWRPRFWRPFDTKFQAALLQVYRGFYRDDEARLDEGLAGTGLVPPSLGAEGRAKLKKLLRDHFHVGAEGRVTFSMDRFEKSFHDLFLALKELEIRLPADFAFLGLMLVGFHLLLDELKTSHDVLAIYNQSKAP